MSVRKHSVHASSAPILFQNIYAYTCFMLKLCNYRVSDEFRYTFFLYTENALMHINETLI